MQLLIGGDSAVHVPNLRTIDGSDRHSHRCSRGRLQQAAVQLQTEEEAAGPERGARFKRLQAFLTGNHDGDKYQAAGKDLGLSSEAVAMAVHRLRQRFGEVLRNVVGATVGPDHVEEEIRSLMAALRPK